MGAVTEALIRKLEELPPAQLLEVERFIDFVSTQQQRRKAGEELRAMMATIATQQITDADMDEINAAVKQVRAERRQARGS